MKKTALFLAFTILIFYNSNAQKYASSSNYKTAAGIKFLDGAGLTIKHFLNDKAAVEGIAYFYGNGTRITGLYEIHFDIAGAEGLKWYVGPGAHVGFYQTKYFGGGSFVGIDGVLGLDYKIKNAPLNLSLDWQPSFEFGNSRGFVGSWGGFAIRYTF
jgi:hypothetical protein